MRALDINDLVRFLADPSRIATQSEKAQFSALLDGVIGDTKLFASLAEYNYTSNAQLSAMKGIAIFAHKTKKLDPLSAQLVDDKFKTLYQRNHAGEAIAEEDKMTLSEVSSLYDLCSIHEYLSEWNKRDLLDKDSKCSLLLEIASKSKDLLSQMDSEALDRLNHSTGGLVAFKSTEKYNQILNVDTNSFWASQWDRMVHSITHYSHTSTYLYNSQQSNDKAVIAPKEAHLEANYSKQAIHLLNYLSCDCYKINIANLASEESKTILHTLYGDKWESILNTKLIEAESSIFEVKNFLSIRVTFKTLISGALFNMMPLSNWSLAENNFRAIHNNVQNQFYSDENKQLMLCSQFTAITLIASIIELEDMIKKDYKVKNNGEKLTADLLRIPFSKSENLSELLPGRLFAILKTSGAIDQKFSLSPIDNIVRG